MRKHNRVRLGEDNNEVPPIFLVGCFYRRDSESSLQQVEKLDKVLSCIKVNYNKNANCTILLVGDFNVLNIDWETPATKPGYRHKGLCDKLIKVTSDYHLKQVQQKPTKLDNILDLLFTNKPTLIKEVSVIPGLSDHRTVIIDTFLHIQLNTKTPGKINQWSRANWEETKREVRDCQEQYFNTAPSQSAEQRNQSSKHVPQKLASIRRNVPWITRSLRRMCRKKQRLYNKASKKHRWQVSGLSNDGPRQPYEQHEGTISTISLWRV